METNARPVYWTLYVFAAAMVGLLFGIAVTTEERWHQPLELVWIGVLTLGLMLWNGQNGVAEAVQGATLNERWRHSPEQQQFDEIYGKEQEG